MNHDMIKLDLVSHALTGLKPDMDRLSRSDGKKTPEKTKMDILQILEQYGFALWGPSC